jgi:putative ubiquitin-RnfH superfamily antitoxin RatB of RatAB toxin-antitoxin module
MSLETELQNVIAATSALNQTVQGKIDAINSTVNSAVTTNDARATSAINSVTSAVNAELGNIRPYSTNYVFWNTLKPADRIRIFPAMVIGHPWQDGQYVSSEAGGKNPVVWDNEAGG